MNSPFLRPLLFKAAQHHRHWQRRDFTATTFLHNWVIEEVIERTALLKRSWHTITQIGSLDKSHDEKLKKALNPEHMLICDPASSTRVLSPGMHCVQSSFEAFPLRSCTFDAIFSFLNLHYVNDLPGVLCQIYMALKPDGFFQACLFGEESLKEWASCLYELDEAAREGVRLLTPPLLSAKECGNLLRRAGFTLPIVDRSRLTLYYKNPPQLLKDIQAHGQASPFFNKSYLGKDLLNTSLNLWKERHETDQGIPLTLDILFLSGFRKAPHQQKPLPRGSAKFSLIKVLS